MDSLAYPVTPSGTRGEIATTLLSLTRREVLAASMADELNQPLTGIMANASTCLRMLAADPPNVAGALETARRTVRDGNRATGVIKQLRALFSTNETTAEEADLNEAAREIIALSLYDLQSGRVILQMQFTENLSPDRGDRIQLRQATHTCS